MVGLIVDLRGLDLEMVGVAKRWVGREKVGGMHDLETETYVVDVKVMNVVVAVADADAVIAVTAGDELVMLYWSEGKGVVDQWVGNEIEKELVK